MNMTNNYDIFTIFIFNYGDGVKGMFFKNTSPPLLFSQDQRTNSTVALRYLGAEVLEYFVGYILAIVVRQSTLTLF